MNDYDQPEFYRFNSDSIKLVKWVKERTRKCHSILDLGAGCGILGLELGQYYGPSLVTFVEFQQDFEAYLRRNAKRFLYPLKYDIAIVPFSKWHTSVEYDLIVSNPPYYLPHAGRASPDERRRIARSFVQDGWPALLKCTETALSKNGRSYFVIKGGPELLETIKEHVGQRQLRAEFFPNEDLIMLELSRLNID